MSQSLLPPEPLTIASPEGRRQHWRIGLEALVGLLALVPIALFLITSLCRLSYPFPLEQLEGSMLLAAERVAHGLPIYVQPNFNFIPYMYAPAYYYVSGWMVRLLGPHFLSMRLISLLSTCGSMAIIYGLVFFDTPGSSKRRHLAALVGAALFAATYPWTRQWFDLARLDSFYVFLVLIALICTRRLHPTIAAFAWVLAFLTKQTIFPVALIMLCADWRRPRRVFAGVGTFLLLSAISIHFLNVSTHGWLRFYVFSVPHANADLLLRPAIFFIPSQILAPFGIGLLLMGMAWAWTRPAISHFSTCFYLFSGISLISLCWFLQSHAGATLNTAMPAFAILAVLSGISFGRLDARLSLTSIEPVREPARKILLVAIALPLISWSYNPHDVIPHRELTNSHKALIAWLRSFPGDVFLLSHPYEGVLAGKQWHPDNAAIHDVLQTNVPDIRQSLVGTISAEIHAEKFDAIVMDGLPSQVLASQPWLPKELMRRYPILGIIPGAEVGDPFGPHAIYFLLPCREQERALASGWTLLQRSGQNPCASD